MNSYARNAILLPLAVLVLAACAVRLGGGGARQLSAVAVQAPAAAAAADVAAGLRAAGADLVLVSADRDGAWFAEVAAASGLELSGPGMSSGRGFAFLGSLELLGDTSLVLDAGDGSRVHMHDALYGIPGERFVDMMLVSFEGDLRDGVRTLFSYIATDVPADAAVLLAIDAATPALADSAAILMRAHYNPASECGDSGFDNAGTGSIRLLYGPSARISCSSARTLPGLTGVQASVVVGG
jgi:hypothetical protein